MNITRREVLKQCLILTVGAAIMPACVQEKSKPAIALKNLKLDTDQEELVTELCETIIPATDTPGAKDTLTHVFVLRMLDDLYTKEEQQQFVKGLKDFDDMAEKKFDKSFIERDELVQSIVDNKNLPEDLSAFFALMKKLTVQGYMTSKYYLTNVRVYKLVPGKYYGCIPVTKLDKKGASI
jgi:hypothetical protein